VTRYEVTVLVQDLADPDRRAGATFTVFAETWDDAMDVIRDAVSSTYEVELLDPVPRESRRRFAKSRARART
jgi:hypothetical protein